MLGKRGEKAMYCIYCGTHYPEQAAFCPKCGKPVHTTDPHDPVSLTLSSAAIGEATVTSPHSTSSRQDISISAKWIRRLRIPLAVLARIRLVGVLLLAAPPLAGTPILL